MFLFSGFYDILLDFEKSFYTVRHDDLVYNETVFLNLLPYVVSDAFNMFNIDAGVLQGSVFWSILLHLLTSGSPSLCS